MSKRTPERREAIARWLFEKMAARKPLPFGLNAKDILNQLIEEDPKLGEPRPEDGTPLSDLRKRVQQEVVRGRGRGH